jgi:hypothetical protein
LKSAVSVLSSILNNLTEFLQIHAKAETIEEVKFVFLGESKIPSDVSRLQTEHVNFLGVIGKDLNFLLLFFLKNILDGSHVPFVSYSNIDFATYLQLAFY